jgi:ABC-2 type transport system permease protein
MIPPTINLLCLGFTMSGLTTLFSSWDRYRWRSIGIGAKSAESLEFLQWATFLSAFEPQIQVHVAVDYPGQLWSWKLIDVAGETGGLGPLGSNVILLSIGLLSYLAATWIFCRRDLPAPI